MIFCLRNLYEHNDKLPFVISSVSQCGFREASHADSNTGFATPTQALVTEKSQCNCSAGEESPDQWQLRRLETQTLLSVTTEAINGPDEQYWTQGSAGTERLVNTHHCFCICFLFFSYQLTGSFYSSIQHCSDCTDEHTDRYMQCTCSLYLQCSSAGAAFVICACTQGVANC